jgi:hypothetical protein
VSPPAVAVPAESSRNPAWFGCNSTAECTLMRDPICYIVAANVAYTDEIADWVREHDPRASAAASCTRNDLAGFPYAAVCVDNRCLTQRTDLAGKGLE